jgi:hypothetical protein
MQHPRSEFRRALKERLHGPGSKARTWVYVPYDQLHDGLGTLAERPPEELGIVLVESPDKAGRRPYHKQKLALVLANLRHFALEQAARGVDVRHVVAGADGYRGALAAAAQELGPLVVHEPAERELREELRPLVGAALTVRPHTGWLTTREQFTRATGGAPPYRMDAFYRVVRKDTGILMERGKPVGGKLSFDAENRKAWRGTPSAPEPLRFVPDAVTMEVGQLVERHYASHPGELDLGALPATLANAEATWRWALNACLPHFGPYEDAMSRASAGLFHTRISALLNLHRLLPSRVIADVLAADLPLPSREGFVRQVLGWREFVRHVHVATDGFRDLPWGPEPHAAPSFLGATHPLPAGVLGQAVGPRLPRPRGGRRVSRGLLAPHHAPDGAGQPGHAAGRFAARAHGLVLVRLRGRLRLGGGAQRAGHGHLRRRRADDHQALRGGRGLHPSHERLLRELPLRPQDHLPHHAALLGVLGATRGAVEREHAHGHAAAVAREARAGGTRSR